MLCSFHAIKKFPLVVDTVFFMSSEVGTYNTSFDMDKDKNVAKHNVRDILHRMFLLQSFFTVSQKELLVRPFAPSPWVQKHCRHSE